MYQYICHKLYMTWRYVIYFFSVVMLNVTQIMLGKSLLDIGIYRRLKYQISELVHYVIPNYRLA